MEDLTLEIVQKDIQRPWGGFFVIDESQAEKFAKHFFPEEDFDKLKISEKLSPKILMEAEIWQHTNAANPSDEDDIVRLQDDF